MIHVNGGSTHCQGSGSLNLESWLLCVLSVSVDGDSFIAYIASRLVPRAAELPMIPLPIDECSECAESTLGTTSGSFKGLSSLCADVKVVGRFEPCSVENIGAAGCGCATEERLRILLPGRLVGTGFESSTLVIGAAAREGTAGPMGTAGAGLGPTALVRLYSGVKSFALTSRSVLITIGLDLAGS